MPMSEVLSQYHTAAPSLMQLLQVQYKLADCRGKI